ncbi:MAG: tetratricopeptide repeat protein [Chthonomonadales bacterium]
MSKKNPSNPLEPPKKKSYVPHLSLLLIVAVIGGLALRREDISNWMVSRQSTGELKVAAELNDSSAGTRYEYALRLWKSGQGAEAQEMLVRANNSLASDDNSKLAAKIWALHGYLLAREGRIAEASPFLEKANKINDDDTNVHLGLGIVLEQRKMSDYAETQYKLATNLDPNNVEAWYRLGHLYVTDSKSTQALEPLQKAIQLAPGDAASHAELGEAYARQSKFDLALPEFQKAVDLEPANGDYRVMLASSSAMSARSRDEYTKAQTLLSKVALDRPEDEGIHFTLGGLHLRFGNVEEARKQMELCVTLSPKHAEGWYNLAMAERRAGNNSASDKAMKVFQKLSDDHNRIIGAEKKVSAAPRDASFRAQLAEAYLNSENYVGAYWQYWTAAKLDATMPKYKEMAATMNKKLGAMGIRSDSVDFKPGSNNVPGPPPPEDLIPRKSDAKAPQ